MRPTLRHSFAALALALAVPAGAFTISNEFVTAVINADGDFSIGTTGGHPDSTTDNGKKLLYGHPFPGTSDTFIQVDGVDTQLDSTTITQSSASTGSALIVTHDVSGIEVTQTLTLVRPVYSPRADAVKVLFRLTNTTGAAHNVALRTQLDTMLGDNDGAPFRVLEGNVGAITTDTEFDSDGGSPAPAIPSSSIVFDDLASPTVVSMITFLNAGYRDPDRVVFGHWGPASGSFDYTIVPGRDITSDTSVIIYWGYPTNVIALAPGQSVDLVFLYGVTRYYVFDQSPFTMGVYLPEQIKAIPSGGSYSFLPNPFIVTVFFENTSNSNVNGARIKPRLPVELMLDAGETMWKDIEDTLGSGTVVSGSTVAQVSWDMTTVGRHMDRRRFALELSNGGLVAPLYINIQGLANAVYGQVTDQNGNPLVGASVRLYRGTSLLATTTSQADGTYLFPDLSPGRYTVKVVTAGRPDLVFEAEAFADPDDALTANPVQFPNSADKVKTFSFPNPAREGFAHISFFLEDASSAEIEIFSPSGELIATLDSPNLGSGWREVLWGVDGVANGVYFYNIKAGGRTGRGKIAVVKWVERQ